MSLGSTLADLRKRKNWTQVELATSLGLTPVSSGQKKISFWESNISRPDADELAKLAKLFEIPLSHLENLIKQPDSGPAFDLFARLSSTTEKSLLVVCYSGRPRITVEPATFEMVLKAVKNGLAIAMCVPYPLQNAPANFSSDSLLLHSYYNKVWGNVMASKERIVNAAPTGEIAIYGPRQNTALIQIPPFFSRYALLIEPTSSGSAINTLYLWVETAESKQMHYIGKSTDEFAREQIESWEAYFAEIIRQWKSTLTLPRGEMTNWQFLNEKTIYPSQTQTPQTTTRKESKSTTM